MKTKQLKPSQISDEERKKFFTNFNEVLIKRIRQIRYN